MAEAVVFNPLLVKFFTKLGLSVVQAKVYLTLVVSGQSDPKVVAGQLKISEAKVSRVLCELYTIGLVEKVSNVPAKIQPKLIART